MAVRDIIQFPDPCLSRRSEPVVQVDDAVRALSIDLIDTMQTHRCGGLSAPQVGEARRIVVTRNGASGAAGPTVLINPRLVSASDHTLVASEGCASNPGVFRELERPAEIEVAYTDLDGHQRRLKASGLLAISLQHQLDHLDGVALAAGAAIDPA